MKCAKISIGDLRFKIEIIDKSMVSETCKLDILTPVKKSTYAKIEVVTNPYIIDSTNIESVYTHKFIIRYTPDIDGRDIVKFDNRFFEIKGAYDIDERKQWTVIKAVERGSADNNRNII